MRRRHAGASLRARLAAFVARSPALSALNYSKGQLATRLGLRAHQSGATHAKLSLEQSVEYVRRVVEDYLRYAGWSPADVVGKRILEIGPGDNLGVALSFVALGARSVTCLERTDPVGDERRNVRIYEALGAEPAASSHIDARYGLPVETALGHLGDARFDLIVSRAVLEHVRDVEAAWHSMVRLLAPGGEMWHKVDLRHHGYFGQLHPLHFLTVGERTWNLISSPDPTLNRERRTTYARLAGATFAHVDVRYTHVMDHEELMPHSHELRFGVEYGDADLRRVEAVRPRLRPRFRDLSDEDLLTTGIFLVCRRPKS